MSATSDATYRLTLIEDRKQGPVRRLTLRAPGDFPRFQAGQYLGFIDAEGAIPFSIASIPSELPTIAVHYWPIEGHADALRMDRLLSDSSIRVNAPKGNCWLPPDDTPLFAIAFGSGVAQCLAMIRQQMRSARDIAAPFRLCWCVREAKDLYMDAELRQLETADLRFGYQPLLGHDLLLDVAAKVTRSDVWRNGNVVISGGVENVYAITDLLLAAGIPRSHLFSDVFDYAPRAIT